MSISLLEVKELFIQLWPPGRLYDWYTADSYVSRFFDGVAEALLRFGHDLLARLRREINPATAEEKLPDWEEALDLADGTTAQKGSVAQRQAGVIGKLREFGAFTLGFAEAALAPLLGYVNPAELVVLETRRDLMRAAHSYSDGQVHTSLSGSVQMAVYISDGGAVSRAGAHLRLELAVAVGTGLMVVLHPPSGLPKRWELPVVHAPETRVLYAPEVAGAMCNGVWQVSVDNTPPGGTLVVSAWSVYVDGVGPSGLGGDLAEWGVFVDPGREGVSIPSDRAATARAMTRFQHAHTEGHVVLSLAAIPDEPETLPDQCLPV